jgi:hypothetical protein
MGCLRGRQSEFFPAATRGAGHRAKAIFQSAIETCINFADRTGLPQQASRIRRRFAEVCELDLLKGRDACRQIPAPDPAMQIVWDHLHFYQSFLLKSWNNMSPMQYGYLLVSIAVVGWACMKSGGR